MYIKSSSAAFGVNAGTLVEEQIASLVALRHAKPIRDVALVFCRIHGVTSKPVTMFNLWNTDDGVVHVFSIQHSAFSLQHSRFQQTTLRWHPCSAPLRYAAIASVAAATKLGFCLPHHLSMLRVNATACTSCCHSRHSFCPVEAYL